METDRALTDQIREILATTLRLDESEVPDDISQDTCARWTSLNHMMLLTALEEHLDLTFSMDEMTSMTSLPKLMAVLQRRGVASAA